MPQGTGRAWRDGDSQVNRTARIPAPPRGANAEGAAKVPAVTLGFWVIKIVATTLGETGGDSVSMALGLGYLVSTAIFMAIFLVAVNAQIATTSYRAGFYWAAIVASTTVGTTLADFVDRSLGIGYPGGTLVVLALLGLSLAAWHRSLGSIDPGTVATPKSEAFYWLTIMLSQTLGTALGDWTAGIPGLGYLGGAAIFGGALALIATAALWTKLPRTALFWAAFVLTRPLGAVVGDFLDKPVAKGGLELGLYPATTTLLIAIVVLVALIPQRAAARAH
ncbi:COG4705 family protein [Luteimonas aquatica]|uniref:COG4705 family protein n=1 Tax=Luteimonas aquatica TaxID=450364 RepID=UPI001F578D1A|nr:hypothetical protein [Luteimonas aquatica]